MNQMEATLQGIREDLEASTAARKCHQCGCFHDAVETLEGTDLRPSLAEWFARAQTTFAERRYDCLGCKVCWPADALNKAEGITELPPSAGCPTDLPERRGGWPPFPGEYDALQFTAPIAVCTLHSNGLASEIASRAPSGLCIAGALQTENLGIERIVENTIANPHIRVLLVCGDDTAGKIGHFPGQTLLALSEHGVDARGRIVNAEGKRPILKNIDLELVDRFRRQVTVLDHRGCTDVDALVERIERAAASAPGPLQGAAPVARSVRTIHAEPPRRLVLDRAEYVVVVPDRPRGLLVAEHYENRGVLTCIVEGTEPSDVVTTLLEEGLVTRADHAAYLGRELTLARLALDEGRPYVQDRAPESAPEPKRVGGDVPGSGCGPRCGDAS